jgi:membrane protein DedA with SNARE-associated domain
LAIFTAMALESCCVPIPSELVMPYAGYLAFRQDINAVAAAASGTLGCLIGSYIAYYMGRVARQTFILRLIRIFPTSGALLSVAEAWYIRLGAFTVFLARLVPGVRTFISLPAGMMRVGHLIFFSYTLLGSLIWCTALTYIGYSLGPRWRDLYQSMSSRYVLTLFIAIAGIGVLASIFYWLMRRH